MTPVPCQPWHWYIHSNTWKLFSSSDPVPGGLIAGLQFYSEQRPFSLVTGHRPSIVLKHAYNSPVNTVIGVVIGVRLVGDVNPDTFAFGELRHPCYVAMRRGATISPVAPPSTHTSTSSVPC